MTTYTKSTGEQMQRARAEWQPDNEITIDDGALVS